MEQKLFMTGQEKGDLLIQLTTWAGLTILSLCVNLVCIFWRVIYLMLIRKFPHSLHLYKEQNLKFLGHKIMVYQLNWETARGHLTSFYTFLINTSLYKNNSSVHLENQNYFIKKFNRAIQLVHLWCFMLL
jgi:hypothetical protein